MKVFLKMFFFDEGDGLISPHPYKSNTNKQTSEVLKRSSRQRDH